ncbi:MAG: PfkB family carbohydrate kinase [Evtepia sp.]
MTQREQQILQWIREDPMISQEALAERAGITRSSVGVHISNLMKKGHILGKGYLLPASRYVAVAGAVNVDIGGRSKGPLVPRDSNPGRVTVSLGGVGRNIAHNLTLLGVKVHLLTALGEDVHARQIEHSCQTLDIDLSRVLRVPEGATSTYLFLSDQGGDMVLAVSDMDIYEKLTPDYFARHLAFLNGAALVVADANLPAESLVYLAEHCTAPLFVDPVSTVKGEKVRPILGKLHTFKPNRLEAELLSGVKITDRASLERAARVLLDTGLERLFLSLGAEGVYAADHQEQILVPCCPARVKNATGGGDAFAAALAWAWLEGKNLADSALAANAAAAIAVEGEETINPILSPEEVGRRMKQMEV